MEQMKKAAAYLVGEHDFTSFCTKKEEVTNCVRTIYSLDVEKTGDQIVLRIRGNGFLYNMVRAMVGTCVYASEGKLSPDDIPGLLEGRNRTDAGPTAPPQGLYMTNLWYPVPNLP